MNSTLRLMTCKHSIIFLFCISLSAAFISACKNHHTQAQNIEKEIIVPKDEAEFQQKITAVLEDYIPKLSPGRTDTTKYMSWQDAAKEWYQQNNYKAIWVSKDVLSQKGKEMMHFLRNAEFLGLNKALYDFDKLKAISDSLLKIQPNVDFNLYKQLETGLTRSFFQMALHVDRGMFIDTVKGINTNFQNANKRYTDLLNEAVADSGTSAISAAMSTLEPDNPIYNRFMQALKEFVSKNNISSTPISIRDPKADSLGAVGDARKALVYHHYLVDSLVNNDAAYLKALKKFQTDNNLNGDGAIGANTIRALERDNSKKFQLLAINADRWRKEQILKLPEKYVWVNLPAFKLRIIENDTVRLEKRVVIGKVTEKAETPILESAIRQIILWPTWTVPQDIIKHEMKSFKGYIVTKTGNWTSVVQPPGPKNSLGSVKLVFPNKYSVYIHDTPAKSLFNADFRAASHGCVRCQDALEVAANLMIMDTFKITYDTLKAWRDEKIETRIFLLKKAIPVYFRYFTAEADFDGEVKFYADVYKRDKDMIDFIFNNKKPHVPTKRGIAYADSIAQAKKKKSDSALAEVKLKEKEKLLTPNVSNYSPKADTISAKHDSL